MSMQRLLNDIARRTDPATRQRDIDRWRSPPPQWLTVRDALNHPYQQLGALLETGEVTWGVVFMANTALWEPGDVDSPMSVVYSFDPWFQRAPQRLRAIGNEIYRYHDSDDPPPRRPWERAVYDALHSGQERAFHQELPPSLVGARVVYQSTVMGIRSHLPGGFLTAHTLPLLVQRRHAPKVCMVVPSHYWPRQLLAHWQS